MIWCRDVTEILDGEFDRLEGMKEFEQKCFRVSFPCRLPLSWLLYYSKNLDNETVIGTKGNW